MQNLKVHIRFALGYFLVAALMGVLLRVLSLVGMPVNYKFIVHTHSHIALLGWVYLALVTLIYKLFVRTEETDSSYRWIFWFTQLTLLGMLLTFPFQGYGPYSILFSTLFLCATYWFLWYYKSRVKLVDRPGNSYRCIEAALWYLVLSSIGPWALGLIMNTLGPESIWYRIAIYFYLHFQYNGWMSMALFGIFLYILEQNQMGPSKRQFQRFFWSLNLGIVLAFFLSTLWTEPDPSFNLLGGLGALLQFLALFLLIGPIPSAKLRRAFSPFQASLVQYVIFLLVIKMGLQLLSALPYFADLASTILDFTIGYLHLTFLGVVTMALFLMLGYFKMIKISEFSFWVYFTGFVITEGLIFYRGVAAWQQLTVFEGHSWALASGSLLIPLALISLLKNR